MWERIFFLEGEDFWSNNETDAIYGDTRDTLVPYESYTYLII